MVRPDSQLRKLSDATDPIEAWNYFGGTRDSLYQVLREEPTGVLVAMAHHMRMPDNGYVPRLPANPDQQRELLANHIADRLANRYNGTPIPRYVVAKAPAPPKTPSHTARQKAALDQATTALGPNANEPQRLRTALLEAAAERLASDPAFAARVRERYAAGGEQTAAKPSASPSARPTPITNTPRPATLEVLNPYHLLEDYGRGQLRAALEGSTQRRLRTAVGLVQSRNPGTKPAGRSNADMIDYIVSHMPPE